MISSFLVHFVLVVFSFITTAYDATKNVFITLSLAIVITNKIHI